MLVYSYYDYIVSTIQIQRIVYILISVNYDQISEYELTYTELITPTLYLIY